MFETKMDQAADAGPGRWRRLSAVVVVTFMAGAGVVVTAAPASAAVLGIQRVAVTSASNLVSPKSVTATCPVGKRLLGTGAEVRGGLTHHLVIDDVIPNAGLTAVTATAYNDEYGFASSFSVMAYAVCAYPLVGLQLVSASSVYSSAGPKSVSATCPIGTRVVGTGADIAGGTGQVILNGIVPNAGLTAVTAIAYEDPTGTFASWRVRTFAICALPPLGLQLVSSTTALDFTSPKSAVAACPFGKLATGVGGHMAGGAGNVFPSAFRPQVGLGSTLTQAQAAHSGAPNPWQVRSLAICA